MNEQLFAKPLNEPTLATQGYNVPTRVDIARSQFCYPTSKTEESTWSRWDSNRLDTGERTECSRSPTQINCQDMGHSY